MTYTRDFSEVSHEKWTLRITLDAFAKPAP